MNLPPDQKEASPDETASLGAVRKLDPEGTKREILRAARAEFAEKGFSGARVEEIGARTKTATRMIYYYFGNKEGLYVAALEQAYADIRAVETELDLEHLSPVAAMCRLVDFTFEYERDNEDFVRIISSENINYALYLRQSKNVRTLNSNILEGIYKILEKGYADGSFHRRVIPLDLHLIIIALCFYRVSNRHTFSAIFACDLTDPAVSQRHKGMIRNAVVSFLRSGEDHPGDALSFEWAIADDAVTSGPMGDGHGKDAEGARKPARKVDPEGTRREILRVAMAEFAEKGFSGARIDEIGARTKTAKRMIYYYFKNKEGLYVAALEEAYGGIRSLELTLDLDRLSADDALCRLIDFTFDYERKNVAFVRLISSENMNCARYIRDSKKIRELNGNVITTVGRILDRGYADGSFTRRVPPEDIHFMISALCFYRVSNQYTFSEIFGCDLASPETSARQKAMIRNAIRSYLRGAENYD